jgi:hypothetical protein
MAVPLTVLQALASSFSAVRDGPEVVQPGQPTQFRVVGADSTLTVTSRSRCHGLFSTQMA